MNLISYSLDITLGNNFFVDFPYQIYAKGNIMRTKKILPNFLSTMMLLFFIFCTLIFFNSKEQFRIFTTYEPYQLQTFIFITNFHQNKMKHSTFQIFR